MLRLQRADCVLPFLTLHSGTWTWSLPWWSIYTTRIGQCYKPGLAPFPPSQLLNMYQHTTGSPQSMNSRSYYSILWNYVFFLFKYNSVISKVDIYLLIIYFEFLRFLATYLWVPVYGSAYCRYMRRLKGYLHIRLKILRPRPFGYAKVPGRLTTVLGHRNTWTL